MMNYIKVLGSSGSKSKSIGTSSFQVFKDILIDAGNVLNVLGKEALDINHIFLTHAHADHILDLPFIVESFFEERQKPLVIYGLKETLETLQKHFFNGDIWPDFSKIDLLNLKQKSLIFKEISLNELVYLNGFEIKAIKANHIAGSCGYVVSQKGKDGFLISGDTYENDVIWRELNNNKNIKSLLIECSFPSSMKSLAKTSLHLTPELLYKGLQKLERDDVTIFIYHIKPSFYETIKNELLAYKILQNGGKILQDGDEVHLYGDKEVSGMVSESKFSKLLRINAALSSEHNIEKLLEMILVLTKEFTGADGGTLYICSKDEQKLEFKVVQTDSLGIKMGGTQEAISWPPLPLYLEDGQANNQMVAAVCALEDRVINIPDVYIAKDYNFEGAKKFDQGTGYRSTSMLVVPLKNHNSEIIGVLQLINKTDKNGDIIAFNAFDEESTLALASQAAMALTNTQLIQSLEEFLDAFVTTIGHAIDEKSPYTGGHVRRVAKIALLLAEAIDNDEGVYKDIRYSENDYRQIELAAWMHDVGKISMPEYVMDKAKKLEGINDRVHMVQERFEILKRDAEISYLKKEITKKEYLEKLTKIESDWQFIQETNVGGEFMSDDKITKLQEIASKTYLKNGRLAPLLTEDEVYNLSIRKGTLTKEERQIINNHAKVSFSMLSELPFPKKYNRVLDIACNHHEKLNGKGYPRGLDASQLTLEDRILVLADIFEALTASDRPYKEGKKLSEVFKILSFMVKDEELDPTLLRFFHANEVLTRYAKEELKDYQINDCELDF